MFPQSKDTILFLLLFESDIAVSKNEETTEQLKNCRPDCILKRVTRHYSITANVDGTLIQLCIPPRLYAFGLWQIKGFGETLR